MKPPRLMAGAALLLLAAASHALEFKTVGAAAAILYDAPSTHSGKLFIAPYGMPLEVVLAYGEWVKVRDAGGDFSWTESKALSSKRHVIVRSNTGTKVHAAPDEASSTVFVAEKGVLLEPGDSVPGGWIKVRHRDGLAGFVKAAEVWGI
jgi:SH3-like domain-containing protein